MNGSSDLRDRLHREMLASERAWSSEEIAREVLRIVSDAGRAYRLVGAMLGADPRFARDGASWRARPQVASPLDAQAFLLCDLPSVGPGGPLIPLYLQPWEPAGARTGSLLEIGMDGSGLEDAQEILEGRLPVSATAAAARRRLHHLERAHALPALSERLLDLTATLRLAGEEPPPSLAAKASASVEERLGAAARMLERALALYGSLSPDEIEARIEASVSATPVDFTRYTFSQADLEGIPERPGVYRFIGEGGTLLYVGKSRDLRRRVGTYFRPLAADHQRRARLLAAIRSLEWEALPSELEALLVESETIRSARPSFNEQIAVRVDPAMARAAETDLAFVLCEGDPDGVSLFMLRGRDPWMRGRLPRGPVSVAAEAALRCVRAWWTGETGLAEGILAPLDAEGRTLVCRYLRLHHDRTDRLRLSDFPNAETAAEALATLAARSRPSWDPWSLRAPAW